MTYHNVVITLSVTLDDNMTYLDMTYQYRTLFDIKQHHITYDMTGRNVS